jgi:microcystin-dependent protein
MNIYGQLVKAKLEQLSDDLSTKGLIWYNTGSKKFKFHDGDAVRELVDTATAQTITNKTLTTPVIAQIKPSAGNTLTLPDATDNLVSRTSTDTLTNKTLTTPVIAQVKPDVANTLTLPVVTDTLVARTTADTLTNKTLTTPVIAQIRPAAPNLLTLPVANDTLIGRNTADTLTNKNISADNNTIKTAASGRVGAIELNAAIAQIEELIKQACPPGTVNAYAGDYFDEPPSGWLFCHGQAVSRTIYPDLFGAIGTSHGIGNNSTTFNVPDLRGQFIRGASTLASSLYASGTISSNNVTFTDHGINRTGFKVRVGGLGFSPTGLTTGVDYYAIVIDSNTLAFASTYANAIAGTKIAISGSTTDFILQQWEDPDSRLGVYGTPGAPFGSGVGSRQENNNKSHTHLTMRSENVAGTVSSTNTATAGNASGTSSLYAMSGVTSEANVSVSGKSGGHDARPNNVAMQYIIKY